MIYRLIVSILICLVSYTFCSGNKRIDSIINSNHSYEEKYDTLNQLFILLQDSNKEQAEMCGKEILQLVQRNGNKKDLGDVHKKLGQFYYKHRDRNHALIHFNRAIELYSDIKDKEEEGRVYKYMGVLYVAGGEASEGLELLFKSVDILKSCGDAQICAEVYQEIAHTYFGVGNYDKALIYYKALEPILRKLKAYEMLSRCLHEVAGIYIEMQRYEKAIENFKEAYRLCEIIDSKNGMATILCNLGHIFVLIGDLEQAESALNGSLELSVNIRDSTNVAGCYINFGFLSLTKKNYEKAEEYFLKASRVINETEGEIGQGYISKQLVRVYMEKGDYKNAYLNLKSSRQVSDSVISYRIGKNNAIERKRIDEKNIKELELLEREDELKEHKSRNTIIIVLSVSIILFILLFEFYRKYRNKKKSNLILEERNTIIKEKNKEITDSISYARRIQNAILPSDEMVSKYLPESFILFKPKDIVAGDFYWLEHKDDKVFFAVADCTGHGVPGAMVSVFCNNALNRSVHEKGLTIPGKILDKSREIIISEFEKSDEEVKDGMDIALCSLNGMILEYAGAHNPLWIIRNRKKEPLQVNTTEVREFTSEEFEDVLYELKGERQPVGKFRNSSSFTTHTIKLLKGDMIYLFSDGFVDQFGGEQGKKFMVKKFKRLLLKISNADFGGKKEILDNTFEEWRGEHDQVDDVCLIGIQV